MFFYAGLGMVTYPAWRLFLPEQLGADGAMHRGTSLWNGTFIDTWPSMAIYALIGAALIVITPLIVRGLTRVDHALARATLT